LARQLWHQKDSQRQKFYLITLPKQTYKNFIKNFDEYFSDQKKPKNYNSRLIGI
jgi:hypothetical protein